MEMEEYKQETIQFPLKQIIWKENGILQQHKTCDHTVDLHTSAVSTT